MVLKVSIQCLVFGLFQNVLDLEFPKHPFRSLPGLIKSLNQYKGYCNSKKNPFNTKYENMKIISFGNFFLQQTYSIQGGPSLPPQYDANPMGSSKEQSLLF